MPVEEEVRLPSACASPAAATPVAAAATAGCWHSPLLVERILHALLLHLFLPSGRSASCHHGHLPGDAHREEIHAAGKPVLSWAGGRPCTQ